MRIIKYGTLNEIEITCENCGSILAYTKNDIENSSGEYFGDFYSSTYITCPVCKEKIILAVY